MTTTAAAPPAALPRNLLVFAHGTELVSALEEKQIRPVLVQPGKSFQQVRERFYRVNPDNPGDFQRLLDALVSHKQVPDHILYAWYGKPFAAGEQALRQQLRLGIYSLFHLSKVLLEQRPANTIRLLAVYPGNRETPQPQHEALRAFGRSIAMENPKLVYRTAALDSLEQEPGQAVDLLLREFRAGDEPGLAVCWEGKQRWVKRFREYNPQEIRAAQTPQPPLFKENGVYIITGGAGGVGLIFARHIAHTVNATIVLTGRSDLTPSKEQQLENLRQLGSRVVYLKADVGDRAQVEKLAAETRQHFKTIDGIIHSAGVLRDSFLIKKTGREIEDVFSPKVYGTIHLDEVTRADNLDFFILFSSMVAVFGNAGQCDYAYANHFIDCWAALREQLRTQNRRKGKTTAINWTNWKQGGMQVDEKLLEVLDQRYGIVPIEDREGTMAFETALRLNRPCVGFIAAERSRLNRLMKILPPQETSPRQSLELLIPGDEPLRDDIRRMTPLEVETEMESLLNRISQNTV